MCAEWEVVGPRMRAAWGQLGRAQWAGGQRPGQWRQEGRRGDMVRAACSEATSASLPPLSPLPTRAQETGRVSPLSRAASSGSLWAGWARLFGDTPQGACACAGAAGGATKVGAAANSG